MERPISRGCAAKRRRSAAAGTPSAGRWSAVGAGGEGDVEAAVDQQGDRRRQRLAGQAGEVQEGAVVELLLAELDGGDPCEPRRGQGAEPGGEGEPEAFAGEAVADRQEAKRRGHAGGAGR